MTENENIDWDVLTDSIADGQTILVLGQGISYNYQKPKNEKHFFENLLTEFGEGKLNFHQKDGLFLLKNLRKRKIISKLKGFYEQDFSNPLLEKIADMPFHLVLSLTPDVSLKKVFEAKNFDFEHSYYKLYHRDELEKPSEDKPLLYNLFGCVEGGRDDIYIEHSDLFDYLKSIYNPDSALPETLLSFFTKDKTDTIIFLGCDLDKWYFQLILHLLNIQDIESSTSFTGKDFDSDWRNVYEEGFKVNFINHDLESFVNTLYEQFEADELRKADESKAVSITDFQQKLSDWLDEGSYKQIFMAITSHQNLDYDKGNLTRLQNEMVFKITFDLLNQLKIFITTLKYQ